MGNRHDDDDYPEHLNPFKPLGLRASFKQLKRTIGRKFRKQPEAKLSIADKSHFQPVDVPVPKRGSDPESVTLRGHNSVQIKHQSEIYPRSRFNERVAKAQTLAPNSEIRNPFDTTDQDHKNANGEISENHSSTDKLSSSHVKEDITLGDGKQSLPVAKKRLRRKKKAPLPPGTLGGLYGLNVPEHHHSQWSISSYETDCSSQAYYSETDHEHQKRAESLKELNELNELSNDLQEMSKEIISYCTIVDGDNNVCVVDTADNDSTKYVIKPSMPDLVVSTENDVKETDINGSEENVKEAISDIKDAQCNVIVEAERAKSDDVVYENVTTKSAVEAERDQSDDVMYENVCMQDGMSTKVVLEEELRIGTTKEVVLEEELRIGMTKKVVLEEDRIGDDLQKAEVCGSIDSVEHNGSIDSVEHNGNLEIIEESSENLEAIGEYDENFNSGGVNINDDSKSLSAVGINFVETKSMFIAGSADDLDKHDEIQYNEKAIYITGSCDELIEYFDKKDNSAKGGKLPVPKIRKNKLSRETLLNCDNQATAENE